MDQIFRIEKRESFRVVGCRIQTTNKKGEGRKAVPKLWGEFQTGSLKERIIASSNHNIHGIFGISIYNTDSEDAKTFDYMIAASSDSEAVSGLSSYYVPSATWAVFPCTVETMGKTEVMAITKWLPKSKYKSLNKGYITGKMKSGAPDLEFYGDDGSVEIWVAVQEK